RFPTHSLKPLHERPSIAESVPLASQKLAYYRAALCAHGWRCHRVRYAAVGRRITTGNLGSTNPGLTIRTELAGLTTLHTFTLACFSDMLLSPLSFLSR